MRWPWRRRSTRPALPPGCILRVEIGLYPRPDGTHDYTFETHCAPSDSFDDVRRAMGAALRAVLLQLRNERRCPYHPDNRKGTT